MDGALVSVAGILIVSLPVGAVRHVLETCPHFVCLGVGESDLCGAHGTKTIRSACQVLRVVVD
jgi:isoaspartyl peptidase/L-asparaginase-like protein (Ntn-hydrolase superfamily)